MKKVLQPRGKFCDFQFTFMENEALPKWCLLLRAFFPLRDDSPGFEINSSK